VVVESMTLRLLLPALWLEAPPSTPLIRMIRGNKYRGNLIAICFAGDQFM
jgi:hypothetical protein